MQSNQETVLEEFMQRSFGAQFLYIPQKFYKGTAPKEPADLAWVSNETVALFYLQSSRDSLAEQTEHNRNQAAGYHRLWATKETRYALRGKNRFGDECFVPYARVRSYLTILVVSNECGVHFAPPITDKIPHAVLVIPDKLLHWIADFGGTIVDLFTLLNICLTANSSNPSSDPEEQFEDLAATVLAYVTHSFANADPERRYLSGTPAFDFHILHEHLSRMRMAANNAALDKDARQQMADVFGDLMLNEYASLTATVERAISASSPPEFKNWVVMKMEGKHYSFVVGTVNLQSTNVAQVTQAVIETSKNEKGGRECISILYGNIANANDFRVPITIALPKTLPRKHYEILSERIIELSRAY
ncbi:hypothetical protein [Pseudoduganella flava]|nr:hypothetical protein [Pseudoduganella flava]QGZ39012.1 hypothetical protein GO485_08085 [Pseudoduganella flava]